jgi:hypothetical protein
MEGESVNQYLVTYKNTKMERFHSLKVWPEIQKMLRTMEEVGGSIRVYRLDKAVPEQVWPHKVKDEYMLFDMYRNLVEG